MRSPHPFLFDSDVTSLFSRTDSGGPALSLLKRTSTMQIVAPCANESSFGRDLVPRGGQLAGRALRLMTRIQTKTAKERDFVVVAAYLQSFVELVSFMARSALATIDCFGILTPPFSPWRLASKRLGQLSGERKTGHPRGSWSFWPLRGYLRACPSPCACSPALEPQPQDGRRCSKTDSVAAHGSASWGHDLFEGGCCNERSMG